MPLTEKQRKLLTKKNLKAMKKEMTYEQVSKKLKLPMSNLYYYYKKFGLVSHKEQR
jgi:hypothetical protein